MATVSVNLFNQPVNPVYCYQGIARTLWVNSLWPSDTIGNIELDQYWRRQWVVAWRHQAITWTNVDSSVTFSWEQFHKEYSWTWSITCTQGLHFYPSALRAGGVLSSRSGRADWRAGGQAGGCQTCGTHISVTAWWIFSVQSSMELSRPVVVHCHAHLPICPIWACPWAKNLSNLPQIGSRLCGSHISETARWIYPI